MFLPHIKLNNVPTVANLVNVEPVRAAAAAETVSRSELMRREAVFQEFKCMSDSQRSDWRAEHVPAPPSGGFLGFRCRSQRAFEVWYDVKNERCDD